ncbi:hypothetical protein M408DRAFT_319925 [Serendipita vermifera MAFF 305830]|uniref:BTB domain-containing protein n=1 Tax=Serendipita vermifera MAFF 305830 TaxID=933852 RepID=A0A0C2XQC3_SERVB|nr:hypothetical protein M408DRAFT_319925 [Serendipita vermifera MAFF 305830]
MPSTSANTNASAVSQQNPSHILIARSSTGLSPTETLTTPATASGIFPPPSSSPPWVLHEVSLGSSGEDGLESTEGEDGAGSSIEVDETFAGTAGSRWPGTVKIVVESTTFWAHKEILVFASPFFDAALSGSWSETNARPVSMSSIITIQQTPTSEIDLTRNLETTTQTGNHSSSSSREGGDELEGPATASEGEEEEVRTPSANDIFSLREEEERNAARSSSLAMLQGNRSTAASTGLGPSSAGKASASRSPKKKGRRRSRVPEGFIILKEERATIFHDFLKFVYPHLECTITWKNVEGLMNISDKLCVPSLQNACLQFLLSHAAGKPIKAMRIAEIFGQEELYRESNRFVLENPHGWSDEEMNTLSKDTLLKLEKRRNWFLERVLKLGTVSIAKEYQCCTTCPDPATCARLLEEKWKAGYHALFRFGPAQPSMVFRYLRSLEGVSPPLALTHLSCQMHARTWVEHRR